MPPWPSCPCFVVFCGTFIGSFECSLYVLDWVTCVYLAFDWFALMYQILASLSEDHRAFVASAGEKEQDQLVQQVIHAMPNKTRAE